MPNGSSKNTKGQLLGMPTPQSSTSAPRNTNTVPAIEEKESFKANVSIMIQDQCLDNENQTKSNNCFSSAKVNDDLTISNNRVYSKGVSNVLEFNVDVNKEYNAGLLMVQNRTSDDISQPTRKVLSISKNSWETPSNFVDPRNNSNKNLDTNKSECVNNIFGNMTVITHQNSNENIRDVIENSEKENINLRDSQAQLTIVEKCVNCDTSHLNPESKAIKRCEKCIRSDNKNECVNDQIENPVERLNKIRASISSALNEVKGVLQQYSTEQNSDGENKSTSSKKPPVDGPVKFRFVRKIRRRSVFSEYDGSESIKTSSDLTTPTISSNKVIEELSSKLQNKSNVSTNKIQIPIDRSEYESFNKNSNEVHNKEVLKSAETEGFNTNVFQDTSELFKVSVSELNKTRLDSFKAAEAVSTFETPKEKNRKTKNNTKIDRRASIATMEKNKVLNDPSFEQLDLKTQRRPSVSGSLIKTPTKENTIEKSNLPFHLKLKTKFASKTEDSKLNPIITAKTVEISNVSSNIIEENPGLKNIHSKKTQETLVSGTVLVENVLATTESCEASTALSSAKRLCPTHQTNSNSEGPALDSTTTETVITDMTQIIHKTTDKVPPVLPAVCYKNEEIIHSQQISKTSKEAAMTVIPKILSFSTVLLQVNTPEANKANLSSNKILPTQADLHRYHLIKNPKVNTKSEHIISSMLPCIKASETIKVPDNTEIQTNLSVDCNVVKYEHKRSISETSKSAEQSFARSNERINGKQKTQSHKVSIDSSPINTTQMNFEPEMPISFNVPKDALAVKSNLIDQESVEEFHILEEQLPKEASTSQEPKQAQAFPPKKKKAKRKVIIRRMKRKLSKDDNFFHPQETPVELEICEKEIEVEDHNEKIEEKDMIEVSKQPKSCLKVRQFEIGDMVMYAEHYKKTQVKWKKAIITERITSISYKLNIEGEERPAHISYIKKFTDRKVNFGGKEYLEIDYAQIEEKEEKERRYSIWDLV